jgi:signal transduction histidine kinase
VAGHRGVGELATAREIVRENGGAVSIRICAEKGSIVTILLPRAKTESFD